MFGHQNVQLKKKTPEKKKEKKEVFDKGKGLWGYCSLCLEISLMVSLSL
jgi:hypothetical protein